MGFLCEFIDCEFNGYATPDEISSVCKSTIKLFPSLADSTGGIVSLNSN